MTALMGLHHITMIWVVVQLTLMLSYFPESAGLTYDELVMGGSPVIPHAVQAAGNVSVTQSPDGMVTIAFKGLPNHDTMMVNPNSAVQQDYQVTLPEDPMPQDYETCLSGGPIGWTIHGVALYNPFNAEGTNAVEGPDAETFDSCQGHPDERGSYHYHQLPDICVFPDVSTGVHGIALDGFPIYGPYKEDGTSVQESDLDKCHGRCGEDGKYRYHMTKNYPYILGCFRGTPMTFTAQGNAGGGGQRPRPPPPGGRSKRQGPNQCAFNTVQGDNFEFTTCSAQTGTGTGSGNASGRLDSKITFLLPFCVLTWMHKLIYH